MCPVGCNTCVDMREGKVKRVRSRNHHEIDEGWFCDKGRFALHAPARGRPHRRSDPARCRRRGFEPVSWDAALDEAERLLRAAHGRVVVALSGSETVEQAYALAKLVRQGPGSHEAMLPEEVTSALDAYRLPLVRDRATRRSSPCSATCRSPRARRSSTSGCARRAATARRSSTIADDVAERRDASCSIWSGPGGRGGATRRAARREARPRRPGRLRRLLRARDPERPRRRRRLGRRAPTTRAATWTRSAC